MSFLSPLRDLIQQGARSEPIECPRGWGQILFPLNVTIFLPGFWVSRVCPISGAESCAECTYPPNPDTLKLEEHLCKLDGLKQTGALSAGEFEQRRLALIVLHQTPDPGEGFRKAAWILGPLGTLLTVVGTPLAFSYHPVFWLPASAGAISLALCCSFAGLARRKIAPTNRDLPAGGADLARSLEAHEEDELTPLEPR